MRNIKRVLLVGICLILMTGFVGCEKDKYKDMSIEELESSIATLKADIEQTKNGSNSKLLEIQDGFKWEKDGDYMYVRGSVKNIGDIDISYFEVTVEYLDTNSNVLDSDYTNNGQLLKSGNMKEFEIMHKYDLKYKSVRVYVSEAR